MKHLHILATVTLLLVPGLGWAEDFDGSKPLICASVDTLSCAPGENCAASTTDALNIPQFLRIDFTGKAIKAERPDGDQRTSEIRSLEQLDNELILQGTQGGLGWSLTITRAAGKMSLSAVGDRVAFVIFGACTRL